MVCMLDVALWKGSDIVMYWFMRWLPGCCVGVLLWLGSVCYAQQSGVCRQKLQQKDFQGAAACFEALFKQYPQKLSFLRNQGIIHRMWAEQISAKKPAQSCQLMGRAIQIFERYSKQTTGVDRLEMVARVARLKGQRKLVSLSITTTPEGARLLMVGYQYKTNAAAPMLLTGLCPGTYHLRVEHKEYFPRQTTLVLKPGQTVARNIVLKPRKEKPPPRAVEECPMEVSHLLGRRGCEMWHACRKRDGKACSWISLRYRERGDFVRTLRYSSMACEIDYYPACLRAAVMHQSQDRLKLAYKYLVKGCKSGLAETCHKLGDFYAGRFENRGDTPRQCRRAIRTYHRACQLGRKESCTATCNTINVVLPIIAHSTLHLVGLVVGAGLLGDRQQIFTGASLVYGGIGLFVEMLYLPLWYAAFQSHSLGLQIGLTLTTAIPLTIGLAFLIAGLTSSTSLGIEAEFARIGTGTLAIALPIHVLWVLYTWLSFNRHKDAIKDIQDPAPTKVTWFVTPTFTPESAGFAISGTF